MGLLHSNTSLLREACDAWGQGVWGTSSTLEKGGHRASLLPLPTAAAQPKGTESAAQPLQPTKGMPVDKMEDISCKNSQSLQVKLLQPSCVTGQPPHTRGQGWGLLPSVF